MFAPVTVGDIGDVALCQEGLPDKVLRPQCHPLSPAQKFRRHPIKLSSNGAPSRWVPQYPLADTSYSFILTHMLSGFSL